ncbi:MAG: hypothetical protein ACQES2_11430 [Pseudomonadota bacterium]
MKITDLKRLGGLAVLSLGVLLTACESSDQDFPLENTDLTPGPAPAGETQSAYFVDSAVVGLAYVCGDSGEVKTTVAQGLLECALGDEVTFSVGDIVLGSITMAEDTVFITPVDLVGGNADQDSNEVVNMARFLMSLDTDQNPDNGITISSDSQVDTGLVLNFSQTPENFTGGLTTVLSALTQGVSGGPFSPVALEGVKSHFVLAMYLSNAGFYAGEIQHSSDITETIAFMVSRGGAIYGTNGTSSGDYAFTGFHEEDINPLGDSPEMELAGDKVQPLIIVEEPLSPDYAGALSPSGETSLLRLDGGTGATILVDAQLAGGSATGSSSEMTYPSFTAERELFFEPDVQQALIDELNLLMPVSIDIGGDAPFVISRGGLAGFPYAGFGASPSSQDAEKDADFATFNALEIASAKNQKVRIVGMSFGGYIIDVMVDLSGESPTASGQWGHIHEEREGTFGNAAVTFNSEGGEPILR